MDNRKYVAAGFFEDSKKLINRFTSTNSVRFINFAKVWREIKFSLIFMGREKPELPIFVDECFKILTSQLLPKIEEFSYKCGILYTIYAMYLKQICEPKIRVRLTMDQFNELVWVVKKAELEMHLDVCFVFISLCYRNAFYFVCHPTPLGPRTRNNVTQMGEDADADEDLDKNLFMGSVFKNELNEDFIDELELIHERYENLKEIQADPEIRSLKMANSDIVKETRKAIKKLEKTYSAFQGEEDDDSEPEEGLTIAARRAKLRESQFEAATSLPRSRRNKKSTSK